MQNYLYLFTTTIAFAKVRHQHHKPDSKDGFAGLSVDLSTTLHWHKQQGQLLSKLWDIIWQQLQCDLPLTHFVFQK